MWQRLSGWIKSDKALRIKVLLTSVVEEGPQILHYMATQYFFCIHVSSALPSYQQTQMVVCSEQHLSLPSFKFSKFLIVRRVRHREGKEGRGDRTCPEVNRDWGRPEQ